MDDPGTRPPEAEAVTRRGRTQEIVDLPVGDSRILHVGVGALVGLNQVVAVNRGGHGGLGAARSDELEERHLGCGVLHGHAVRPQLQIAGARIEFLAGGMREVAEQDLLCVGEGTVEAPSDHFEVALQALVDASDELGGGLDCSHGSSSLHSMKGGRR